MKSYDVMAGKINEQESYDDKLKHKYLKSTLKVSYATSLNQLMFSKLKR